MIGWVGTCRKTRQAGKMKRHLDAGGVFDVAHLHARAMDSKSMCGRAGFRGFRVQREKREKREKVEVDVCLC